MYKPFFITVFLFILLASCAPVNNEYKEKSNNTKNINNNEVLETQHKKKSSLESDEKILNEKLPNLKINTGIQNVVTIILSHNDDPDTVRQFINIVELAVYQKKLQNISFEIKLYKNNVELKNYLNNTALSGKIFIGPLSTKSTSLLGSYCDRGAIFFSFSADKNLANDCIYLVNFFPENEMRTLFEFFPNNSKVALLYPENHYGFGINKIIDDIADQSNSIIVSRASYNQNLSDAPKAIKELGKYELRKYELNRQKKLLSLKKDEHSKQRLIKLERFKTTQDFDFTHVVIADYGLRLLQIAPLLPYYDIDPNIVKFVGTGAWDDEVFYDEPSLNGSIYPGIEYKNRKKLANDFKDLYKEKLLRTSTLPFDLVGLLSFVINNNYNLESFYNLLNKSNTKLSGVDGSFYFINNIIERDLNILEIRNGKASILLKQE